ncbi:neuronal acetylcholine receptor subunit alpha-6 [Eurytemora carolleeae]|uniref:neuronal acetylcholine receptor subunit alpha-6 n=1 Tax=Eurytemora carolleeae TaxID=1294199 RepID=UPI000C76D7B2|nr:neuronal acetylcholine receptor subunit alpha-6 [Eurytemora carolleeae]|eukprot:XP_023321649.1 neuronal acetylcholine receptor subunit alpha-6-like [Eurytemora affinis]
MNWKDTRLKWIPENYENVSVVHLGPDKVWKPDIMVYNSLQHFDYEMTDVGLVSSGLIWWVPPVNLHTSCELDWTYWPWDYQKCRLLVGSWTKTGWELDITTISGANISNVDRDNFVPGAWDIVSGIQQRIEITAYKDNFVELQVDFVLQRRSFLDKKVAVLPLLVSCCLILSAFWIHPSSTARLRLNLAAVGVLVITLLAHRSFLPSAGGQMPMIVAMTTGLVVLAVVQLAVILSLANLVSRTDSPSMRFLAPLQMISPFLCLGNLPLIGQVPASIVPPWSRGADDTENLQPDLPKLQGWNLIAQAVDRLMFIVYTVIVFFFLVSYIGAASANFNAKTGNN